MTDAPAAKSEALTEFPWRGFYGGKAKRVVVDYEDTSSSCIGDPVDLESIESPYSDEDMRTVNALIRKGRIVRDGGSGWPSNCAFYVLKEHRTATAIRTQDDEDAKT